MKYEIDFIGVPDADSADAIAFRWIKDDGTIGIGIYDGGTTKYAEALCDLLNKYYFFGIGKKVNKIIDFVVCSHSDQDHCAGLQLVLQNFNVKKLYLNIPWNYLQELMTHKKYSQTTEKSLTEELKKTYNYVAELEKIATANGIPIYPCFQGKRIEKSFFVLAPTKEEYIKNIINSKKEVLLKSNYSVKQFSGYPSETQLESWYEEKLPDNNETSSENECSVILLGNSVDKNFLLTGDAGINDLTEAIDYCYNQCNFDLSKNITLYQLPHHGGGKNICPDVMDLLVGPIQYENKFTSKIGIASAGTKDYHPYKIAVNAFTRRGVSVYVTKGKSIHYTNGGFPERSNYSSSKKENLYKTVEKL